MDPMKLLSFLIVAPLVGCASISNDAATPGPEVAEAGAVDMGGTAALAAALTGTFSSAAQAAADPDNFFDIRLVMQPIWEDRADGPWLYVEQAAGWDLAKPYRQRVYRLVALEGTTLRSDVYTLPGDPLKFVAAWDKPELFAGLTPNSLGLRHGCSIYLEPLGGGSFAGATRGDGCSSTLADALYATSEVTMIPGRVTSWDRGWAADGTQAWGAEKAAYVFDRID